MSKTSLSIDKKPVGIIDNKVSELNKFVVLVEQKYIHELEKNNIPYKVFTDEFYIVKRGRKPKKFNNKQVEYIKKELNNGLSIRKAAEKYKCSSRTIQQIKNDKY